MKYFKNYFIIVIIIITILLLFKYNTILSIAVISSIELFITKVFPTLFIMFIINDIIINSNILNDLLKIINPIFNKIFNTSGASCEAFILSIFSGTPSSAFILKEMLNNNKIEIDDANKLIRFTYFSNPLFLYNILSTIFNKYITLKIIIIHYFTNIIIGLLYRGKKIYNHNNNYINHINNKNIIYIIPNAISKSFNTLLIILGSITFYMIISNLLTTIFKFNILTEIIVKGFLEITQSLSILNKLNTISIIKEIIAISIISFGGISIHTQIISIISDTKISYKNFLTARIFHLVISAISYFLCSIL